VILGILVLIVLAFLWFRFGRPRRQAAPAPPRG
jgi:hypothetical protein